MRARFSPKGKFFGRAETSSEGIEGSDGLLDFSSDQDSKSSSQLCCHGSLHGSLNCISFIMTDLLLK